MRRALLALVLLLPVVASAQSFDLETYRSFLEQTADLSSADLLRLHDASSFLPGGLQRAGDSRLEG